ncbi:hypothetical protein C8Q76DRAFT_257938 [Earliella scabrosa]|nr:hypothetical protein C8Q76DRAFT_257938 [Earliella scabrosa]
MPSHRPTLLSPVRNEAMPEAPRALIHRPPELCFPAEIWRQVFQDVEDNRSVASAALICSALRPEAEAVLYRRPRLMRLAAAERFKDAIVGCPRRGRAVRVLVLGCTVDIADGEFLHNKPRFTADDRKRHMETMRSALANLPAIHTIEFCNYYGSVMPVPELLQGLIPTLRYLKGTHVPFSSGMRDLLLARPELQGVRLSQREAFLGVAPSSENLQLDTSLSNLRVLACSSYLFDNIQSSVTVPHGCTASRDGLPGDRPPRPSTRQPPHRPSAQRVSTVHKTNRSGVGLGALPQAQVSLRRRQTIRATIPPRHARLASRRHHRIRVMSAQPRDTHLVASVDCGTPDALLRGAHLQSLPHTPEPV